VVWVDLATPELCDALIAMAHSFALAMPRSLTWSMLRDSGRGHERRIFDLVGARLAAAVSRFVRLAVQASPPFAKLLRVLGSDIAVWPHVVAPRVPQMAPGVLKTVQQMVTHRDLPDGRGRIVTVGVNLSGKNLDARFFARERDQQALSIADTPACAFDAHDWHAGCELPSSDISDMLLIPGPASDAYVMDRAFLTIAPYGDAYHRDCVCFTQAVSGEPIRINIAL
jgi:hypothetical protein